jgi:hypothetical protein
MVHTTSGDATVRVPSGSEPYRVQVRTASGRKQVGVDQSEVATRLIDAESASGDVTIAYA